MNTMTYKGYTAKIQYDGGDRIFVGEVLGLKKSIIGFHADNVEDLEKEFHDMIDFYLECCKKDGKKPEKPTSGKKSIEVPLDTYLALSQTAAETGQSVDDLVDSAVRIVCPGVARDEKSKSARCAGKTKAKT